MAQDPYGYEDSAPGTDASRAMWFGTIAAMLGSVGVCFCYVPYLVALPMAVYAAWLGYRATQAAVDAKDKDMATAGMVSGIISSLVSGMFVIFMAFYALFVIAYIGVIFAAIGAGAMSQ